jgi:hypothetical protein
MQLDVLPSRSDCSNRLLTVKVMDKSQHQIMNGVMEPRVRTVMVVTLVVCMMRLWRRLPLTLRMQ